MGSMIVRAKISNKNPYYIEKHRYYELKHFCLQYSIWNREYSTLTTIPSLQIVGNCVNYTGEYSDPTCNYVMQKLFYRDRMDMVRQTCSETDPVIGDYIFVAVTDGQSYEHLKARLNIPCSKDIYYMLYRKFFWILDKKRK